MTLWTFLLPQALVFALWAVQAFTLLFRLRARAEAVTGHVFSGPASFIGAARASLSDPADRPAWRRLGVLTALLVLLSAAAALLRLPAA